MYNFGDLELSLNDELILREQFNKNATTRASGSAFFFNKAKMAYANFDFSQLSEFDNMEVEKVREAFETNPELQTRPLLFSMYILYRNGFLDSDYFINKERVFDLCEENITRRQRLNVPEGLITSDGKLYGIGKDGHIWLFNFLNLCGVDTQDAIRYSSHQSKGDERRKQYFSKLKEFESDEAPIYLSVEQAKAIDNLRRIYDPRKSLEELLLNETASLGFRDGESVRALKANVDAFYDACPECTLDVKSMIAERREKGSFASFRNQ